MATPGNNPNKITYFAETDYRSKRIKFGIRDDDRARHMYVIGKTGMGKSTLLENLAIQDIQNGEGLCFIDPHGGTAETLLSYVPEHRIKDVIYFAPFDQEYPVGLNVLEDLGRDKRPLIVSGLMGSFKKVWVDAWSARMEYILNNTLLALLENPGSTLLGVNRMYSDKAYRNMIVSHITDPSVRAFWVDEYAKYSEKFATEATAAIQNKVGQFAANPLIRNMMGQPKSTFDIRKLMDERKIFIVNLSKGRMGEGNANLVGSMLITKIYLAAMSRADVGPEAVKSLPPFYLYVDEFQSFANESFADILSEARKYKLSLTVAHQYIEQMSDEVRAAVFGNVGSMISFRVGAYDAEVLEKEFAPAFTAEDMVNLGFAQVYLKLMINGVGSAPFSATTLNRPKASPRNYAEEVVAASREQFARPRAVVEEDIKKWHEPIPEAPRDPNAPLPPETRKYAPGTRPERTPTPLFVPSPSAVRIFTPLVPEIPPVESLVPSVPALPTPPASRETGEVPTRPSLAVPKAPYAAPAPIPQKPPSVVPLPPVPPVPKIVVQRPPAYQVFGAINQETPKAKPTESSASVITAVHQPFKQEFSKLNTPPEKSVGTSPTYVPRESKEKIPERNMRADTLPLSLLKSQPKKDKGPSEGNLTSLKAALEAAMAAHKAESAAKEVPPPSMPSKSENAPRTVVPPKSPGEVRPTPPQAQAPKMAQPLLSEVHDFSPREVPAEVLRGLLSD